MTITITGHFDGQVIVPEEPLNLPPDQWLKVDLTLLSEDGAPTLEQRRDALERFLSRAVHGLNIPDKALRREAIYEEDE